MNSQGLLKSTSFLGYEKGKTIVSSGERWANHRNGHYEGKFLSFLGIMEDLKVSRDRAGEFYPNLLETIELSSGKVEDLIIAMYAKGLSTRDIGDIVESICGFFGLRQLRKDFLCFESPLAKVYTKSSDIF